MIGPSITNQFTVSSYNCGGLSDHYDYLRAAVFGKIMQERHTSDPETMALNEKIQKLALQILFPNNSQEVAQNGDEMDNRQLLIDRIVAQSPDWRQKLLASITDFQTRPVVIYDSDVSLELSQHMQNLNERRASLAKAIFAHQLKFDILCLQEADYLNSSLFPDSYEVRFSTNEKFILGIAWKKERFDLIEMIGEVMGKALIAKLRDKRSDKTVLVASAHLSGCDPYQTDDWTKTGDSELTTVMDTLARNSADHTIIGMDSNVTSLHPRLKLLKLGGFHMDSENFVEPTCTNPYKMLNTRIDWIALKVSSATLTNIPVLNVGLNSPQTNMSDHKPVAAKITY